MSRWLITIGLIFVAAGVLWPLAQRLGIGRLPGDIVVERGDFRFYFPLATSLILSILLSLVLCFGGDALTSAATRCGFAVY